MQASPETELPQATGRPAASASAPLTVMWFRQDLRLRDNPALRAAARRGAVLPLYILDDENAGDWAMGAASRWWLHHSLKRLNDALGGRLQVLRGDARGALSKLCDALPVARVVWNRCYEPWRRRRDRRIIETLREAGVETGIFNGSLLWDPRQSCKEDGSPYRVFTPFHRNLARHAPTGVLEAPPRDLETAACAQPPDRIERLGLLPKIRWHEGFESVWHPGEDGARARLRRFLENAIADYRSGRDLLSAEGVSALSPHLHFGEISPLRVWREAGGANAGDGGAAWIRQLYWREFCYHLLYHYPEICDRNFKPGFERFPWRNDPELLRRWQQGRTGIPLVDAGMRELWRTGTMHNRARMVAASFLTKNLLVHWLHGARWFWDCLVDADLANNSCGWQWVAGCGADAAPYFRIFNPVLQSRKFDPSGTYLRRWLPELAALDDRHIHAPWEAGAGELRKAGVKLDKTWPSPIVDLGETRKRALAAAATLRGTLI